MSTKIPKFTMTGAATRAKAKVGKFNAVGYCLRECVVTIYQIPPPWGWGGNGKPWAINYWFHAVSKGKVVKTSDPAKIPAGAMAFMSGGVGHVFIGAGDGFAYSTDRPKAGRWGRVSIRSIELAWGKKLVGYIEITGDGYDLRDSTDVKPPSTNRLDPAAYFIGATGDHVLWLGQQLMAAGFGKHYKSGPSKTFTEVDRLNVVDFQHHLGFTGTDADGFPGVQTLTALLGIDLPEEDPDPIPDPPEEGEVSTELRLITYNVRGQDHDSEAPAHKWNDRRAKVLSVINNERPSWILGQEVNTAQQVRDLSNGTADNLKPITSRGRNYLWRDVEKFDTLSTSDRQLTTYQDRRALIVKARRKSTGKMFWVVNTHAPSGNEDERTKFARALVKILPKDDLPLVVAGDLNKGIVTSSTLRGILEAAGLRRLETVDPAMVNQTYASFNNFKAANHDQAQDFDEIYTRGFKARDSELILAAPGVSDHYAKVSTLYF